MILIVDDLPANIFSLQKVLEVNGFAVDTAGSGTEALKKVLKNNYVLIILDVQMPDMDGFEVAAHLNGLERTRNTAIVFLSANSTDVDLIVKGYSHGAADYITKPVDANILLLKVKTLYALYETKLKNEQQQKEIGELYEREKNLNESLSKSSEKLIEAQRIARMGNWEYQVENNEVLCSADVYSLLNIPADEVVDIPFILKKMPNDERNKILKFWFIFKERHNFEFVHRYKDGKDVKYLKQYGKIEYRNKKPYKITGIVQDVTIEKLKDAQIIEAYKRYELVNLATNDLLWDWDLTTNLVQCNDNISAIYGYRKKDVGKTIDWWQSIINPNDAQHLLSVFIETARQGKSNCSCEYRLRCADNSEKEVFNQSYCLYNSRGELQRIVCAVKDLSELRRTEKELVNTEFKLLQTIESINEGFFTCDNEWQITYWNRIAEQMLGKRKDEVMGKNLWDLFPETRKSKFFDNYSQCILNQKPYAFEEYSKDRWYRVNVHPSEGGIAVYFVDITDDLLKGLELNNARIQTETINKATWDIIWEWDLNMNMIKVNKNFSVHLGYNPEGKEFNMDWWKSRIHPEDRDKVHESIMDAFNAGLDTWEREYRFSDSKGNYHFVRDRAIFFRDEMNMPYKITGSMSDIQEFREIESRMKEIAFSNSHVIRKPLANILGLIAILDETQNSQEIIGLIKQSSEELDDAIKKIGNIAH
jgi:PAS domain S-box-containing protein